MVSIISEEVLVNDSSAAKTLKISNIKTQRMPEYMQNDSFIEKVRDPTLKAILGYWNDPSILTVEVKLKTKSVFRFCHLALEEILKETVDYAICMYKQMSNYFGKFFCKFQ